MSMLLPHVCLKATMLCTCALTSSSRSFYHILGLMMSRHVTAMSRASSSSLKRKEIQKKRNIKSRKIDKRKRKMLMSKVFHNSDHITVVGFDCLYQERKHTPDCCDNH